MYSIDHQICYKTHLFPVYFQAQINSPALFKSQFISVHACVCVCLGTNVMWENFGMISDCESIFPHPSPRARLHVVGMLWFMFLT